MLNHFSRIAKYLLFAPMLLLSLILVAQQSVEQITVPDEPGNAVIWQKAMVNAAGGNYVNGVEVFYRMSNCNSKKQILLKFINTNSENVLIEWADGIYTGDKQWIQNERNDKTRELNLKGNKEIQGNCSDGSLQILKLDLDQYSNNPEVSFRYAPSFIDVTK